MKVCVCMCMCLVGKGRNGTAQQLSSSSLDTAQHMSAITEEVERHNGKVQQSSTGGSAVREMHDSSSSWTDRSLPSGATAAAKQAAATYIHTADTKTSQMDQIQPVCQQSAVHAVGEDMPGPAVVCVGQAATAVPDAENGMSFMRLLIFIMHLITTHKVANAI